MHLVVFRPSSLSGAFATPTRSTGSSSRVQRHPASFNSEAARPPSTAPAALSGSAPKHGTNWQELAFCTWDSDYNFRAISRNEGLPHAYCLACCICVTTVFLLNPCVLPLIKPWADCHVHAQLNDEGCCCIRRVPCQSDVHLGPG